MSNPLTLDQATLWQLLELIASPDCDIDSDLLAEALDDVINGSPADREAGIETVLREMARYLPTPRATDG